MHISVSHHATDRFKSRYAHLLPPGADDDAVYDFIKTLAREGLSMGGTTLASGAVRIQVRGIKMIVNPANGRWYVTTILSKVMAQAGRRPLHGRPNARLRAYDRKDRGGDDGW